MSQHNSFEGESEGEGAFERSKPGQASTYKNMMVTLSQFSPGLNDSVANESNDFIFRTSKIRFDATSYGQFPVQPRPSEVRKALRPSGIPRCKPQECASEGIQGNRSSQRRPIQLNPLPPRQLFKSQRKSYSQKQSTQKNPNEKTSNLASSSGFVI